MTPCAFTYPSRMGYTASAAAGFCAAAIGASNKSIRNGGNSARSLVMAAHANSAASSRQWAALSGVVQMLILGGAASAASKGLFPATSAAEVPQGVKPAHDRSHMLA